ALMKRRGRGIACMWYPIGFTVAANPSAAVVKVNEDGTATLLTGTVETGQGSLTVLGQIAAEALGIATDDVHVVSADTDTTPMDTGAIASRTTYVTGNAVRLAAEKAKTILYDVAAPRLGVKPDQLEAWTPKPARASRSALMFTPPRSQRSTWTTKRARWRVSTCRRSRSISWTATTRPGRSAPRASASRRPCQRQRRSSMPYTMRSACALPRCRRLQKKFSPQSRRNAHKARASIIKKWMCYCAHNRPCQSRSSAG
ncbi:MAG: molybdopterin-dependent oxidoreductase, partial [Burkholderiales bacterium]|nr:molybdopterin-dependent oxidoreductase [Burkholderiales bacterium]